MLSLLYSQISYGVSSSLLNDRSIFRTLFRTSFSDKQVAAVLTSLITSFGWSCINIISSKERFHRGIMGNLKRDLKKRDICIALHDAVGSGEISSIVMAIKVRRSVFVNVVLGSEDFISKIFSEARRKNLTKRVWIRADMSNERSQLDESYGDVMDGMLTVSVPKEDLGEFKNVVSILAKNVSEMYCTWIEKDSRWSAVCGNRSSEQSVGLQGVSLDKTAYVMNAVLAVTQTVKKVTQCTRNSGQSSFNCLRGNFTLQYARELVLKNLEKITFRNSQNTNISFTSNRELNKEFDIMNVHAICNKTIATTRVGKWTREQRLVINETDIQWPGKEYRVPYSGCRERCPLGTYTKYGWETCWWNCHKCPKGTFNDNHTATLCKVCPKHQMPNELQTGCVDKPLAVLVFGEMLTVTLLSACGLGEILTLLVLGVLVRYQDTPVVKATNLTFTVLSLLVLAVWFLNPVLYIGKPSDIVCKLRTVSFAVLYTTITAVLLTKTNRLIKIFSALKQHCFLSNCWYGFLTCALILVQIGLSVFHLLVFPPRVTYDYSVAGALFMSCEHNLAVDLASLGYDSFLATICSYLAYKSRNLPRAYNEFKWICLSMFTNFLSWTAILICHHTSLHGRESYICAIMALILGAYSMLFLLFLPKVRVIFFRPEKNTKQAAIESTRRYSIDQASGIDLSPIQGMTLRRNTSPACLAFQFMNGSMNKLPVVKQNLGPRRSQGSIIATIKELPEERKSSV